MPPPESTASSACTSTSARASATVEKFAQAVEILLGVLRKSRLPDLEYVDFGGGIGVPYRPAEKPMDLRAFGAMLDDHFGAFCKEAGKDLTLVLEPGRFPVAECGYLVVRVNTLKETPYGRTYAGVDSGFNHLVRPTMYGSYHHITNLSRPRGRDGAVLCRRQYLRERRHLHPRRRRRQPRRPARTAASAPRRPAGLPQRRSLRLRHGQRIQPAAAAGGSAAGRRQAGPGAPGEDFRGTGRRDIRALKGVFQLLAPGSWSLRSAVFSKSQEPRAFN